MTPRIAPSAMIEDGAEVDAASVVWDLSQIRSGARIGPDCTIGRNVFIDAGVVVGARCKIQNNALLYAPARLGDGVFVGPAAVLTNDRRPRAVAADGTTLTAADWEAPGVAIDDGASIGAGAIVVAGVSIGAWALIGAGAVVVRDVPAFSLVVGNPARRIGWVGRSGARLVPHGPGRLRCPDSNTDFADHGDHIEELA